MQSCGSGEAISGEKVKAFTEDHNEILKLDLNSKYANDEHFVYQLKFAFAYTKAHNLTEKTVNGEDVEGFYTNQFFGNVFNYDYSIKRMKYTEGGLRGFNIAVPIFEIHELLHPTIRPYFLRTSIDNIKTRKGTMFGKLEYISHYEYGLYLNFGNGLVKQGNWWISTPANIKVNRTVNKIKLLK